MCSKPRAIRQLSAKSLPRMIQITSPQLRICVLTEVLRMLLGTKCHSEQFEREPHRCRGCDKPLIPPGDELHSATFRGASPIDDGAMIYRTYLLDPHTAAIPTSADSPLDGLLFANVPPRSSSLSNFTVSATSEMDF